MFVKREVPFVISDWLLGILLFKFLFALGQKSQLLILNLETVVGKLLRHIWKFRQ